VIGCSDSRFPWLGWYRTHGAPWRAVIAGDSRLAVEAWLAECVECGETLVLPIGEDPNREDLEREESARVA
jgi:hypothetical protein